MATFNLCNDWLENMVENADLETDQFVIALSNTDPTAEGGSPLNDGNGILGNVTEVAYTNVASSRNLTTITACQTSGSYTLGVSDLTITASGGTVGPLQYAWMYDDTVSTPVDPLIGYWDYGSSITLQDGESLTVDFGSSVFTLST